ncbi:hypothetical protein C8R44DRAFT_752342 [Mycena epipterygia]|nr:hypothetical protein C8R44DRAFT_752342 [Mycena epipterygia]
MDQLQAGGWKTQDSRTYIYGANKWVKETKWAAITAVVESEVRCNDAKEEMFPQAILDRKRLVADFWRNHPLFIYEWDWSRRNENYLRGSELWRGIPSPACVVCMVNRSPEVDQNVITLSASTWGRNAVNADINAPLIVGILKRDCLTASTCVRGRLNRLT